MFKQCFQTKKKEMTILRAHSDETVSNRKFIETLELHDTFILYGEGAKIIPWRICRI